MCSELVRGAKDSSFLLCESHIKRAPCTSLCESSDSVFVFVTFFVYSLSLPLFSPFPVSYTWDEQEWHCNDTISSMFDHYFTSSFSSSFPASSEHKFFQWMRGEFNPGNERRGWTISRERASDIIRWAKWTKRRRTEELRITFFLSDFERRRSL